MGEIKFIAISGSPRINGNTDYLVKVFADHCRKLGVNVEVIRLYDYNIKPCISCRLCLEDGKCRIKDDMCKIYPKILSCNGILLASPVYFNNVSAQMKAFMDRTWCLRGKLKWKIGGGIVVGRRYGHELALNAIHSFFLKHEIIIAYRGVVAFAYEKGEIINDKHAINCTKYLAEVMFKLAEKLYTNNS